RHSLPRRPGAGHAATPYARSPATRSSSRCTPPRRSTTNWPRRIAICCPNAYSTEQVHPFRPATTEPATHPWCSDMEIPDMQRVLAVDGGNTKTIALVATLEGDVLGAALGGCSD